MKVIGYIKQILIFLRCFIPSAFFCFYYLPFKQAIYFPIWINKPHFVKLKGQVVIKAKKLKPGMIRLGFWGGRMYPNNGLYWTHEGTIIFEGKCIIGNNSFIVTGKNGVIVFGDDFMAPTSAKILSFIGVTFGKSCRFGWDVIVMDTNFHPLYDLEKQEFKKAYGRIVIGDYNWFGTQCNIMHSVKTPERAIFGMRTVVTRSNIYESYAVHGGSPIRVLNRNVMRIIGEDKIEEYI